ncbi:GNAT family N-acetyltransferase [Microbacterium sp. KUDC0406]|uniref:GNAT family N-acetyltransferase n=1 Tax=Microbacterium sp. KUDC0406 TaxID=2909588 RepID=UPI001F4122A2|nr:GNAT family protein [Microbacterium sp. KUDC0406]UJP11043.1 GNAT family N-acetyltransferase [Microbacterium sp. KUDC0406]
MPAIADIALTTADGLRVDALSIDDAPALVEAFTDTALRRWLPLPDPYPLAVAEEWCTATAEQMRESGRGIVRAIRIDGALAGSIDAKRVDWRAMTCELSYWTAAPYRGRGLMPRAVDELSRALLNEHGFQRIELRIAPGNGASLRTAQKAGFHREGTARNAGFTDDGRVDLVIWSRVPADLQD